MPGPNLGLRRGARLCRSASERGPSISASPIPSASPGNRAELRISCKQQNLFVRHPSAFGGAPAHQFPSVGAIDLCPGRDGPQSDVIRKFLTGIFESIFANAPYGEETGLF